MLIIHIVNKLMIIALHCLSLATGRLLVSRGRLNLRRGDSVLSVARLLVMVGLRPRLPAHVVTTKAHF